MVTAEKGERNGMDMKRVKIWIESERLMNGTETGSFLTSTVYTKNLLSHCGCVSHCGCKYTVYMYVFSQCMFFHVFLMYALSVSLLVCYAHDFPCTYTLVVVTADHNQVFFSLCSPCPR